jgi:SAM-dependent methyltransferase
MSSILPDPGAGKDPATMPAHHLLASLGKRVMRPGGGPVGDVMLRGLAIGPADDVLDLAPGLGTTVRQVQDLHPKSFRGIERSEIEAERSRRLVTDLPYTCLVAHPAETGLEDGSLSVIYGEACLSLETDSSKQRIIAEAARLLRPGGRLGLHELLLTPDDLPAEEKRRIGIDISKSVRVGARPLTRSEWTALLEDGGFEVRLVHPDRMLLLDPRTMLSDEGVGGTFRLLGRILRSRVATRRVVHLWRTMQRERKHLGSVAIVAVRR